MGLASLIAVTPAVSGLAYAQTRQTLNLSNAGYTPTWDNVLSGDMSAFKQDSFWGLADDGTRLELSLLATEAVNFGAALPRHLKRREGVSLTFTSPQIDWFIENGAQNITIGHAVLGHSTFFINPVPTRSGSYTLEVVIN